MGYSLHAGQVTVADGTKAMEARLERVLTNDPGMGVARHADAGYEIAKSVARRMKLKMPIVESMAPGVRKFDVYQQRRTSMWRFNQARFG